jgi:haloalkane dehalogenase
MHRARPIGMGDSDKLPTDATRRYTLIRHREFLDALLDELDITREVTLVVHDLGQRARLRLGLPAP